MIISLNAEKAFDKTQHPFIIKVLEKAGIQGTYINIIKAIYSKPTANNQHQTKWRDIQSHPTEIRNKTGYPLSLFNIIHEVLARVIRQQKEINWI